MIHTAFIAAWTTTIALCAAAVYIFGAQYRTAAGAVAAIATIGLLYVVLNTRSLIADKPKRK